MGLTGLTPTSVTAGVVHSHNYTHSSSSCSGHKDPINVVFVENGFASWVDNHAGHHGGWTNNSGGDQWFKAHNCDKQDEQAASGTLGRFHMRITNGRVGPYLDYDSTWHYWSTADAHHEDSVWCGFNPFAHAVDDNVNEPPGGFNMGREDVWLNWSWNGPHILWQSAYWGNTMRFNQCNGNEAWSDGYVNYIEVLTSS